MLSGKWVDEQGAIDCHGIGEASGVQTLFYEFVE